MSISIGSPAPDFTLYNTEKDKISLADYKGRNVVILFFPLAFTGVCTSELCTFRDSLAVYNELNAEVVAISVDSLFTLNKFKKDNNLNFQLLSDFNKDVSTAFGCLYDSFAFDMHGVSKRSAFVLNKEGVVEYIEILEVAGDLPNFDAIQSCLKTLN
jgi:peroxiredoxin